ncbi:MAG: serine/threonine protein kinase [Nanoarchaeota archaeon]|nr:serine/threonine protein kinase [Nanoarchaeota archaeon]
MFLSYIKIKMIQYIGNFKVLEKIGQGGFGTVYKVENAIGKVSALKVLSKKVNNPKKEVKIHANLKHTNIVDIYNYHPDIRAIEMEYLSRGSLADLIKKGPVDHKRTVHIIREILRALHYAHQEGYMHCDVKPSNILLNSEGKIKLSDFGLAKLIENEIDALPPEIRSSRLLNTVDLNDTGSSKEDNIRKIIDGSRIKGTLPYMAPEQKELKPCKQSDIYAVGLILYEMLTNRLPTEIFPELPSKIDRSIPKRLDQICMKALRSVNERYNNANDMIKDLEYRKRRLFAGLKIAFRTAIISSITGLVIGAAVFSGSGEDLPELRMSVKGNEATHAVKVLIPAREGDPAAYIKSKFDALEILIEDKERLAGDYKKALEEYKELQQYHKLQQIDYDREIEKLKTLQKELEGYIAENR